MTSPHHKMLKTIIKRYARDTGGAMAVWATIAAPVLLGGAALSVDASRLYNMNNDLQSAADALARAGAAELDQRGDSLIRSHRAVNSLVSNDQKFSAGGKSAVRVGNIQWLKSIPAEDYMPVTADMVTSNPAEARYVEVQVVPERVNTMFPQGVVRSITSVELEAKSTAGLSQDVCGVAPVFICNPFEGNSDRTIYEAMDDPAFRRRQVQFIGKGQNARYSPGNYGWLDPFQNNSGAAKLKDAIAIDRPPVCLSKSAGVELRPGKISSMSQAVNVRFDMYEGPFKKKKSDPAYAPAANVVKGYTPKRNDVCKLSKNSSAYGMPRDDSFQSCKNTSVGAGAIGTGDWDFVEYMRVNHNYMPVISIEGVTYTMDYSRKRFSPPAPPSRYAMYRWEIDNNCVPGSLTYGNNSQTPEEGLPQCHAMGAHTDPDIDRRIIHVAVLNCEAIQATGEKMNGRTGPLPVETFVKVFITEPMAWGSDSTLWGEIVGPVVQGQDDVARDKVALSR